MEALKTLARESYVAVMSLPSAAPEIVETAARAALARARGANSSRSKNRAATTARARLYVLLTRQDRKTEFADWPGAAAAALETSAHWSAAENVIHKLVWFLAVAGDVQTSGFGETFTETNPIQLRTITPP